MKWIKITLRALVIIFALVGFFFTGTYLAMHFKLTNDKGIVDVNDRYFHEIKDKYNQGFKQDSTLYKIKEYEAYQRILILNKYFPKNADFIFNAYLKSKNEHETLRMLDAVDIRLKGNSAYQSELNQYYISKRKRPVYSNQSVFEWMNISEWTDFKFAVAKDKKHIDSVAKVTGVEPRLIVSCLVGEQIRLFNSSREAYKKWIGPLKILSVETKFSFGVTGIKEHTAQMIEYYLKDSTSKFYLGKQYENLLDFQTDSIQKERFDRLTSYKNHFYSYMYAAVFLKQMKVEWERAGFPITNRPEILATLFNVGFPQSKPKSNPRVGGSTIKIYDKEYSFGAIAYEFYYSGELFDVFPIKSKKFDWDEI